MTLSSSSFPHPNGGDNHTPSSSFRMVEYYAKECYHCQHLSPIWKAAVNEWNNTHHHHHHQQQQHPEVVHWVQRECYGDNWKAGKDNTLCKMEHVNAFPDIRLYHVSGDENGTVLHTWKYDGERSVPGLLGFINKHISNTTVDDDKTVHKGVNSIGGVRVSGGTVSSSPTMPGILPTTSVRRIIPQDEHDKHALYASFI
ncbi:hypothetical protein FOZ60_005088 [Perkinsus olseni]|uniref:Thioredoxin domain-containing protein n=3 Tax=Perkinsus olseni TaxID=32597 RepID=A0A7J6NRM5_PEROL|nr:hypothetical protein FOZ60_005088 [Perkinsus olseni]